MIPFVDLNAQYQSIKYEIDNAIKDCIADGNFIKGKAVSEFEKAFSDYLGSEYCLGCGNGTDALEIILASLKIGPGDEVIVPALTWISTAEAVNNVGAEPVFIDINTETFTIDTSKIEEKITNKTKAIIPVHLYGCPADMNELLSIAEQYGLFIVEDCAQAHGAEYFGRKVGTFGIASAFSFFPSKNLGAFGDGGAVVTSNKSLYETARRISNHGQLKSKHEHSLIGRNSRLDSLQASILGVKLAHLNKWNLMRLQAAEYYKSKLKGNIKIVLPAIIKNRKHVFHLYVIRVQDRIRLTKLLEENNIHFGIHYPNPLPFLEAYNYKKLLPDDFPVSFKLTREILSLPIYPEISSQQIDQICNLIIENF